MSTIKSSAEDLTLNADGSNEVKFQINAVEKASINSSGLFTSTTIDATALTTVPVNKGGTGATTHTANNVLVGNGTSAIGSVAPSTSGNVLTSNGSSWASTTPAGGGKLIQQVTNHSTTSTSGTTIFPQDTTIPQNDEGTEFMTLAITPTSSTNRLRIFVHVQYCCGADSAYAGMGLFQDTTADALNCAYGWIQSGNQTMGMIMDHEMVSGTTSATTFKVRCGRAISGTFYFNQVAPHLSGPWGGGKQTSNLTIQEIEP